MQVHPTGGSMTPELEAELTEHAGCTNWAAIAKYMAAAPGQRNETAIYTLVRPYLEAKAMHYQWLCRDHPDAAMLDFNAFVSDSNKALGGLITGTVIEPCTEEQVRATISTYVRRACGYLIRYYNAEMRQHVEHKNLDGSPFDDGKPYAELIKDPRNLTPAELTMLADIDARVKECEPVVIERLNKLFKKGTKKAYVWGAELYYIQQNDRPSKLDDRKQLAAEIGISEKDYTTSLSKVRAKIAEVLGNTRDIEEATQKTFAMREKARNPAAGAAQESGSQGFGAALSKAVAEKGRAA